MGRNLISGVPLRFLAGRVGLAEFSGELFRGLEQLRSGSARGEQDHERTPVGECSVLGCSAQMLARLHTQSLASPLPKV